VSRKPGANGNAPLIAIRVPGQRVTCVEEFKLYKIGTSITKLFGEGGED